jgi:hypothetical protein
LIVIGASAREYEVILLAEPVEGDPTARFKVATRGGVFAGATPSSTRVMVTAG